MPAPSMQSGSHVVRFTGTGAGFEKAANDLRSLLDARNVGGVPRHNVELAFEEIVTNIIRHGRTSEDIVVTVAFGGNEVLLTFEDNGIPFDPSSHPDPVVPESLDEVIPGGLGLVLVKKISSRFTYERTAQQRNSLLVAIPTL